MSKALSPKRRKKQSWISFYVFVCTYSMELFEGFPGIPGGVRWLVYDHKGPDHSLVWESKHHLRTLMRLLHIHIITWGTVVPFGISGVG